jgi:hypothetical protein
LKDREGERNCKTKQKAQMGGRIRRYGERRQKEKQKRRNSKQHHFWALQEHLIRNGDKKARACCINLQGVYTAVSHLVKNTRCMIMIRLGKNNERKMGQNYHNTHTKIRQKCKIRASLTAFQCSAYCSKKAARCQTPSCFGSVLYEGKAEHHSR